MKLKDAEILLQAVKLTGPIQERWWAETDEGILLEAFPMGYAFGSYDWRNLITVFPKMGYSALFQGIGMPHRVREAEMSGRRLWEQEEYVYRLEMRDAMRRAIERLETGAYFPRKNEYLAGRLQTSVISDPLPHPEDFHLHPPGATWHHQGRQDVRNIELAVVKLEFLNLLQQFILTALVSTSDTQGGPHGQREAV